MMPRFCTAINCMDGRTQLPVIHYLQQRFDAAYVDTVTEAGINRLLAEEDDTPRCLSVHARIAISLERHHSVGLAVCGHHDCAGNPVDRKTQIGHIRQAVAALRQRYPQVPVIGLWVNEDWQVEEVVSAVPSR